MKPAPEMIGPGFRWWYQSNSYDISGEQHKDLYELEVVLVHDSTVHFRCLNRIKVWTQSPLGEGISQQGLNTTLDEVRKQPKIQE